MTTVDLLSDTVYRDQARAQLEKIGQVPVKRAQIYGLRQIARQQPLKVKEFAQRQRERAERRNPNASEIRLWWSLVEQLCESTTDTDWSVRKEVLKFAPEDFMNQTKKRRREWLDEQEKTHRPALFERFCTHALYRLAESETNRKDRNK